MHQAWGGSLTEGKRGKLALHWKMLIGFLAGLALGLLAHYVSGAEANWVKNLTEYVTEPVGTLFLRMIFMLVIPLLYYVWLQRHPLPGMLSPEGA